MTTGLLAQFRRQQKLLKDIAIGTTFTPEQAKAEFDLDVGAGWQVKVEDYEPVERMASFTYIAPEGWQIKPDETQVSPEGWTFRDIERSPEGEVIDYTATSPTGETYKYSEIAAPPVAPPVAPAIEPAFEGLTEDQKLLYREYQRTGGGLDIPSWTRAGAPLRPIREIDEGFLRNLYTRSSIEEAETLLRTMLEGTPFTQEEIEQTITETTSFFVSEEERQQAFTQNIQAVFPDFDIDDFNFMIEEHPEEFVARMREGGYTEEKGDLLRWVGNTQEEIDAFYGTVSPLDVIPPEGIEQTINPPSLPAGYGQPATIRIMPDWEFVDTVPTLRSDDYLIFYEGKQVGKVDAETGGLVMDDPGFWWKAWVPSLQDRLFLSQSGQVPPEAFSGTPLKVQQQFSDWLYTPKQIGETTIPSPATILSAVGAIGTIAITGYYALQQAYQIAARASITRNLRSWVKSTNAKLPAGQKIDIPPETEKAFVNQAVARLPKKFVAREAIRTFFNSTKAGYVMTNAGMQEVAKDALALVNRVAPSLVPTATQTGAMAFGGLPPAINASIWATMVMADKVTLVQSVGLSGQVASKAFVDLTPQELTAISKVTPTAPEVPVTPPVTPEVVPPEVPAVPEVTPPVIPTAEPGMPEAGIQPALIEGVPPVEVRPPGRGEIVQISMEDQLKLEEARRAAEVAPPEDVEAYEAYTEAEGLKANLEVDPVARYRIEETVVRETKKGSGKFVEQKRTYGLDRFISIKEGEFPSYFTLKQAKAIKPNINVTPYSQKGTPSYNRVPRADVLDELADKWGMTPDDIADRVMAIRAERARIKALEADIQTHYTEKPLKTVAAPKEVAVSPTGEKMLTPAQIEKLLTTFGLYVESPNAINAWELTRELRRETLAGKAEDLKNRTKQLIVEKGIPVEEAINQAIGETMRGELPEARTDYLDDLTEQMRTSLFDKVYQTLRDEPFEMMSTAQALTNALLGKPIPRIPGIKGGSAYTRLQRIFAPEVFNAINKASQEGKSLQSMMEGLYEVVGQEPIPVDQATADYLRGLSTDIIYEPSIAREPQPPKPPYEPPIEDAIKQTPLWPAPARDMIIKVLKEIAWSPVDIGNFFRANLASFDFSFWRQQAPLIAAHPTSFVQANIEAWKATWSQKSAEASQEHITRDPLYQIYEVAEEAGGDFLRPLELKKGTAQWRGVEEFGYITGERLIPRLTGKIPWVKLSSRAFVTGTNVHNWLIFKGFHKGMLKLSEMYATGQKTLKPGEVFAIEKEMVDFSKMLANFSARGSLGRFSSTAPILSSFFFAIRASIGRVLSVKDLINANPRVRSEAWKNAALFVTVVGGVILLGGAMGWWQVEKDSRRADYMSIKLGNTRIDPWGGYRQFLVFFTRMITGSGVSSISGAEYESDPIGTITNLVRSKGSPLASIITDFWTGRNFIGEEVDIANPEQWAERIAPFAVQDIYEAWLEDPLTALTVAIPAIVGAGVQTYTGEWVENWPKLGLPKYSDNLIYGQTDPYYDTADFWSDTSAQFAGVAPATLTEEKGYPDYIRAIAEARVINERLATLPNEKLVRLNADATKGATFADYYQMWRDREAIVASGDEDKLKEFDQDDRTRNAHLGNFSQRQFALLNEYWAITDEAEQAEFLKEHEAEIGLNPRQDWFRTHPKENAQLAVWGQAKLLTKEAYDEFKSMVASLDIPDNAMPPLTLPPEESVENYFEREQAARDFGGSSAEAKLVLARDPDLLKWYQDEARKAGTSPLATPEFSERYYELKVKNRAERQHWDTLKDKDSPDYIEDLDERRLEFYKEFPDSEYFDDERRTEAIANEFTDDQIEAWVERGRLVDKYSAGGPMVKEWAFDNPEAYRKALEEKMLQDKGGLPEEERGHYEEWVEPAIRIQADETFIKEDAYWDELGDKDKPETYIDDEAKRRATFLERFPDSQYFDNVERIEAYKAGFTETEAELWADRGRTVGKFEAGSSEALVWLLDNWDLYETAIEADLLKDRREELRKREPVLRINVKWAGQDDEYDAIDADDREARKAYLFPADQPTEYCIARYTRQSYEQDITDTYRQEYIAWFTDLSITEKPEDYPTGTPYWEDNWWMLEHRGYHDKVWVGILENQSYPVEMRTNEDGVQYLVDAEGKRNQTPPTRELGERYLEYIRISRGDVQYTDPTTGLVYESKGQGADQYRLDNPDMDEWGVAVGIWATTMTERRKQLGETPGEKAEREAQELIDWFKEEQKRIQQEALR